MTEEMKAYIDSLSHREMANLWRHAPTGTECLQGEAGFYFSDRFYHHFGGWNPSLSKEIGWGP